MTLHRFAAKRDHNERDIIEALEDIGVVVRRISAPGVPDLLCWSRGVWLPIEIKCHRPRRSLSDKRGRTLTPSQCELWSLTKFPIVETVAEALALFGVRS